MNHGYNSVCRRQNEYSFHLLCFIIWVILRTNNVTTLELSDINNEASLLSDDANESIDIKHYSLRKCFCGADQVMQSGVCIQSTNTSVEYILSFVPALSIKKLDTKEFSQLYISNLVCDEETIPVSIKNFAFTKNNTIFHVESGKQFREFCVEHVVNVKRKVSLEATSCLPLLHVPSCCPPLHSLDTDSLECYKNISAEFNPPVRLGSSLINSSNVPNYLQYIPKCHPKHLEIRLLDSFDNVTIQYQDSGIMLVEWEGAPVDSTPMNYRYPTDFCVGFNKNSDSPNPTYIAVTWEEWLTDECMHYETTGDDNSSEECERIMYWLLFPFLIVSSICLLVVLCLHATMPALRKSMGSKITICHVVSLFGGFCVLILLHIPQDYNCKIYGPLVQCLFLAAFFWLNVMCFDIWWKLRCHNPAGETVQSSKRRFVKYSIYAWSSPVIIGIITVTMDNASQLDGISWIIRPGFGQKHCWFTDHNAALVYYFGFIAFLMATNVFFFVWVFVILLKANCTYNKVLKNNPKANSRTWVYLKVFGVMGVTWIFEFLSDEEGTCKYWIVTDIINSLRGCILLSIYFCNRKSATKIRDRFTDFTQTFQTQISRSVNSLRKLSRHRSHSAIIDGLDSRRTSETGSTDLPNRSPCREIEVPSR